MSKEYDLLRTELESNIKKQDGINNLIFTILGLSFAFTTWYENVAFIIMILFISDILLSRILQCRNTVYYISTYLTMIEELGKEDVSWEKNLRQFRKLPYGLPLKWNPINILNWLSSKCANIIKNFGNLILASFMLIQLLHIMNSTDVNGIYSISIYILSGACYLLNVIFTIAICTDRRVRKEYEERWTKILNQGEAK